MRPIIAIRTNKWTEEEKRLLASLREVEGHDLAVVFHNRPAGLELPLDVVDINNDWLAENGLRAVPDWGWRCGDYFYYALRAARPGREYYWLVEPDVLFVGKADDFFSRFTGETADAFGFRAGPFAVRNLGPYNVKHNFARGLPGLAHYQAIFALTRLSGRAIDRLVEHRRAYGKQTLGPRFFSNDEIFVFSHVAADPDLTMKPLEAVVPDWFEGVRFAPSPDMLAELVAATAPAGRVFHPVHDRASFKRATAARLSAGNSFLRNVRKELSRLDEAEIDEIADAAAERIRTELRSWHRRRRAR